MRPTWSAFWSQYPDYMYDAVSAQVKKDIGGDVDDPDLENTCTIRMSRGLNYSGVPVPANFPGLKTRKGGDKKNYAYRVAEMRLWLPHALGAPDFDLTKKSGDPFDKTKLADRQGIIAFDIPFANATGHLDAWAGTEFTHESAADDYWGRATRITLWDLPNPDA